MILVTCCYNTHNKCLSLVFSAVLCYIVRTRLCLVFLIMYFIEFITWQWHHETGDERHHGSNRKWQNFVRRKMLIIIIYSAMLCYMHI